MPGAWNRIGLTGVLSLLLGASVPLRAAPSSNPILVPADANTSITNLAQLTHALNSEDHLYADVRLEAVVCAASKPDLGVLVVQDATGVELLELGRRSEEFLPGERIRIAGHRLLLRQRGLGIQVSAAPVVDNDGLHPWRMASGDVVLKGGRVPLELDWFNCLRNFGLGVACQSPNGQPQRIPESWLSHTCPEPSPAGTNLSPGLLAECYEGFWQHIPDFDLLQPVRTGTTTNFDLGLRTRDEMVGLRYTGFFDAPGDGTYTFQVNSDDGALLFIGSQEVPVTRLGTSPVPTAASGWIGQPVDQLEQNRWLSVEGRISFISQTAGGLELELRSGVDTLSVRIVDSSGLEPASWRNCYVRAVGVGRAALSSGQRIILSRFAVVSGRDLHKIELQTDLPEAHAPSVAIKDVQTMGLAQAEREVPVRVRGIVTAANRPDRWIALQDDTRGIFVNHHSVSNLFPARAEMWEISGHTAPGNFAPVIVASHMKRLGQAHLPEPARPSWNELANGSMDVQWVEFQGLVSSVQSNQVNLLLPEGELAVQMENYVEADLKGYEHAVIRVRGTLFAVWNADTRQVQFGNVLMRSASVSVDAPPPANPFDAPTKTVRDLLRFEVQANPFSPVKVRAQTLYVDTQGLFAVEEGAGLRVQAPEATALRPGDWFEAVGYPEISGPSPLLRQAFLRKNGAAELPDPVALEGPDPVRKELDSTLVTVQGKLMGTHSEQRSLVLELQANGHLFVARLKPDAQQPSLRLGSRLRLTGVYVQTGSRQRPLDQGKSFELLLNSAADIRVLSHPSWWTLKRLASVVGILLLVLLLAAAWITQLRRQVEQRTHQLQQEIRERERAEGQRAIEAERSRIARDLHDDLGSGLSEINLLTGAGQRRQGDSSQYGSLFQNIASKTRALIAALDVIVWAVDPEDNSLQSLADYLSSFADDFLSRSGLACRLKVPIVLPQIMLDGRVRHSVLMAVKESLNNIVRHAEATEVQFQMAAVDGTVEIVIADNGKGFDTAVQQDRHGLKNLSARLAELSGSCQVDSVPGHGTTVTIRLPLSATAAGKTSSTPL